MPNDLLHVNVGSAGNSRVFQIERAVICDLSPLVRDMLWNPWETTISLEKHEPEAFDLFMKWIDGHETPEVYISIGLSEEPWLSYGADICLLAAKLQIPNFEKEALSHFIKSCALAPFGPWSKIEEEAAQKSPLRRFSNHWVAWNFYLLGCRKNEYTSLEATSLTVQVTEKTRDPRILDIEHWFSNCGDSLAIGCLHDPISREEKKQQDSVKKKPIPTAKDVHDALQERALQMASSSRKEGVSFATLTATLASSAPSHASGTPKARKVNPTVSTRPTYSTYEWPH